ncbi:MAG: Gfo/Idh/MocA family oxidoreductase [Planctomycetes bacterium]|nr:Gfo/Idh/MocA family oxidoreductase [Planctomycetota bacterium]
MEKPERREFIKTLVGAGAAIGMMGAKGFARAKPENGIKQEPGKSVAALRAEPMERVRIGLVGIGMRGMGGVDRLLKVDGVEIVALCDILEDRVASASEIVTAAGRPKPAWFTRGDNAYKHLCDSDLDLVYLCTPWRWHTPQAVYAMEAGKHVASEVPAAVTLDECWQLVDVAEKTRKHCCMLENCCYGSNELMVLNMCRQGVFGELTHGEAAYIHDLRELKFDENGYQGMWRLDHSKHRDGNLYPTHGLGPVAQYMNINRGDRFDYLVSMSSHQKGLSAYAAKKYGPEDERAKEHYALGDMNTTLIRTVHGRSILVQHDTTSPRPYSRLNMISGTLGTFADYPARIALEPDAHHWNEATLEACREKYTHPLWKQVGVLAERVGGHGGMDFIMDYRLIYCLRKGLPLDMDVYDAATWSAVAGLSERSVAERSRSIDFPDFTRGRWKTMEPLEIVTVG